MKVVFIHDLSEASQGNFSLLRSADLSGTQLTGLEFAMVVSSSPKRSTTSTAENKSRKDPKNNDDSLKASSSASHDLSENFKSCMNNSDGVTAAMLECISVETKSQDSRLNNAYKRLMLQLSEERKKTLLSAQRLWLKFRDENCKFYGDPDGGTLAEVSASSCFMEATASRAHELERLSTE